MGSAQHAAVDLRDPDAFREFYRRMLPRVYSFLYHRCAGNIAVAEDITQETFTAAVRVIRSGGDVRDPDHWIFGLARHKLIDHFRAQAREEQKLSLVWERDESDVEWQPLEALARDKAMAALAAMPAAQRAALALRYFDDMSVPEIAAALDRSVHATESLLARGRETFRNAYREARDA